MITIPLRDHLPLNRGVRVMVYITTFNNISAITWRSVSLVEETETTTDLSQVTDKLYHNVVSSTHCHERSSLIGEEAYVWWECPYKRGCLWWECPYKRGTREVAYGGSVLIREGLERLPMAGVSL
jgi:hypothetical protein